MHILDSVVSDLIRAASDAIIRPMIGKIGNAVMHKAGGDPVTEVDLQMEAALRAGLLAITPDAVIIGEEAASVDDAILGDLCAPLLWLVDPVDGTGNFASGNGPFGVMVALCRDGTTEASWTYDPVIDRMCHAVRDEGAFIDGARCDVQPTPPARPRASISTHYMEAHVADQCTALARDRVDIVPLPRCAAYHYPSLALGESEIAVFRRTLPWDHAGPALFLEEAGGKVVRWDGSAYRFHDDGCGIIAAATPELAQQALDLWHPLRELA